MRILSAMLFITATFVAMAACNARSGGTPSAAASSDQARTTSAEQRAPTDQAADVRQVTIPVEGMSCSACAARLKKALKEVEGVVDAEVSLEHSNARVRYVASRTSPEKLVSAIRGLGFTPGTPTASSS